MLLALWGCAPLPPDGRLALPDSVRRQIYERAQDEFARARLIKPAVAVPTDAEEFKFAPLILQEIAGGRPAEGRDNFVAESSGRTNATIYFRQEQTTMAGRPHVQMTYVWTGADPRPSPSESAPPPMQGVRITLDSAGCPAIWEVLADSSGAKIFVVSQSLEAAALAEFGTPRPGRRFSVERDLVDAPDVVLARVIEDGPEPMGPIVYWGAGTGDIVAVACRCMRVQARELVGEQRYDLVELNTGAAGQMPDTMRRVAAPSRLEEQLRLPAGF